MQPERFKVATSTPKLGDVQETLLIPLYLRAKETARPDAIIRDLKAVEIVKSIDYDFSRFDSAWNIQLDCVIRTEIFDEQVNAFLQKHPDAIVVNLGCGLDGRFERLDNGRLTWFDLDMPDSIELRRQFYEEGPRNHFLSQSMFDVSWIAALNRQPGQAVLILVEGVFAYFEEAMIRELFQAIANGLPGAEMLCQTISPRYVNREAKVAAVNKTRAKFKFGVVTGREMEAWEARPEFLNEWHFIDRHRRRWRWMRYLILLPWIYRDVYDVLTISHLRFRNV